MFCLPVNQSGNGAVQSIPNSVTYGWAQALSLSGNSKIVTDFVHLFQSPQVGCTNLIIECLQVHLNTPNRANNRINLVASGQSHSRLEASKVLSGYLQYDEYLFLLLLLLLKVYLMMMMWLAHTDHHSTTHTHPQRQMIIGEAREQAHSRRRSSKGLFSILSPLKHSTQNHHLMGT